MITPWPVSTSPCSSRPSFEMRRSRSRNPNTRTSQSSAAGPSAYAIIGITPGKSLTSYLGRTILAEDAAQHTAALADGDVVSQRRLEHRHEVVRPACGLLDVRQV